MDCSTPGFLVLPHLLERAQTHVHWVNDAIQPSCPLSSPSPALSLSQHQGLFQLVGSSHQVTKVIGASASASVLPMNIQGWFTLGLTGLISLKSKGLSRVFSNTTSRGSLVLHEGWKSQLEDQMCYIRNSSPSTCHCPICMWWQELVPLGIDKLILWERLETIWVLKAINDLEDSLSVKTSYSWTSWFLR